MRNKLLFRTRMINQSKRCITIIELHNIKDQTNRKGQNKMRSTDKSTTFYLYEHRAGASELNELSLKAMGKESRRSFVKTKENLMFEFFKFCESQHALKSKNQRIRSLHFC